MDPTSLVSQVPEMWQFPMLGVPPPHLAAAGRRMGRLGVDGSAEDSTVTEQSGGKSRAAAGRRKRKDFVAGAANAAAAAAARASEDDSSKLVSTSSCNELTENEGAKGHKILKSTKENSNIKTEAEASSGTGNKLTDQINQSPEPPKQDYIHVRARRGQATDSHSLAERARREKISERMKILQDLVPGCNKVIGKASVLDEIINYIQALQRQVEFLSMKLEAVTSRTNSGMEVLSPKDFGLQTYETTY